MPIFVHSKELTQEFRTAHRRGVVRQRARRRRERAERPRDVKRPDLDAVLDRAIDGDER